MGLVPFFLATLLAICVAIPPHYLKESLVPDVAGEATGYFYSKNGQMYDPDGQQWFGRGADVIQGGNIISDPNSGAPLMTTLPGINIVRYPCSSYEQPSYYDSLIKSLTMHKVVIILENHQNFFANGSSAGGAGGSAGVIFFGQLLSTETNWYTNIASYYKSNPYVWFGTNNEPSETNANGQQDTAALSRWQQTTYNAIRGTGNPSPILVEAMVWANFNSGVNDGLTASVYKMMTNMVWDFHIYNWIFNYVDDYNQQQAGVHSIVSQLKSNWQSQDGTPAVFCGEFGPSTSGMAPDDKGGMTLVNVVLANTGNGKDLSGNCAWNYFRLASADYLTNYNGTLSEPYGTTVARWIKANSQN